MSVIDSIELYFVNVPLPAPFSPAWVPNGTRSSTSSYVIRLRSDDGVAGFSTFTAVGRERAGIGDTLAQLFIGRDPTDIDYVQEMLRIPAYGGIRNYWVEPAFWDIARAKRLVDACYDVGIAWVEEPLMMELYAQMAELAAYSRVPVAGGEINTSGLPELSEMIDKRCYHIFQPDAVWTGGIAQTIEVARRARKAGLGFSAHSWTNGIGFAINMQIMAASGFAGELPFEYPICPPGWPHGAGDALLTEPWRHERGTLQVPSKPGLGFDIDEDALAYYGRCFFRAQGKTVVWMPEALRDLSAPPRLQR